MTTPRVNAYLICGGEYHDNDFARLELLKLLAEHAHIRVKVGQDYSDIDTIVKADFMITYTCNVVPTQNQVKALKKWLASGKKWFALHATNSICTFLNYDPVCVGTPRDAPEFMQMMGSQFLAHPPIDKYQVQISNPDHELTQGLDPFDTVDELYLSEFYGDYTCLLHTHFNGEVADFDEGDKWLNDQRRPVMYTHTVDEGEVLYLTLGHCRSTYDMQPLIEEWPQIDRCSWDLEIYYELLRRGIRWCAR
jgi:type 1 glutamine amidotransferase